MNALVILILGIVLFVGAYIIYGGYLAKKWGIDPERKTPAYEFRDDIDYCPADAKVVFGHQFSSIAGAGPITGPIQAVIFGWLPVYLWIVIGSMFIGGLHDWGAVFSSVRHEGKSIGEVIRVNIGETGKKLFNVFAWLALVLVVAAFTDICAGTFAFDPANPENLTGARAGTASILFIGLAVAFGFLVYRKNANLIVSTIIGVALLFFCIWIGYQFPVLQLSKTIWLGILIVYVILASVLPVWLLLQPRDYLCSFLLYSMVGGALLGIILAAPAIQIPAVTAFKVGEGAAAQYLFPMLFITVACGAVSGFHSLVSSGTTSKQIKNEKDTKLVGYGAMLVEGLVAIIAVISVAYLAESKGGTPAQQFASGLAYFMSKFGLPVAIGEVFVTLSFSAFALTSLDTATRLGRYMWQEMWEKHADSHSKTEKTGLQSPMVATLVTAGVAVVLLMYGYTKIWPIFGASNQLLAGLALLGISAWFMKSGRIYLPTLIPMFFMFVVTLSALVILIKNNFMAQNYVLAIIGSLLFVLAVVLIATSYKSLKGTTKNLANNK